MRKKSRPGLTLDRRTQAMGAVALGGVVGAGTVELARVWRRGSAPLPTEADDLLEAASTATLETIAVVREGYRATSNRENAVFNLLVSFTATFGITRASTALIRSGKGYGVFRNLTIADRRVHHFVPGIALTLASGGTSISVRRKSVDRWLALPFGAGAALILDEAALLLELDDVYWSEKGVLSLQVSFGAISLLAAVALAVRLLRRGETSVGITPAPAS
jgi:hypothetical protein